MELARPFADDFDAANLTLLKTAHWSVLIRKVQVTLGCVVLAANRTFISASELNEGELLEFPSVVGRLETALASSFNFDKINYLCLMMVDRHYHFHVIPRYEKPRQFGGREWVDSNWPKPPNLAGTPTEPELLNQLRDHLRSAL
jgi:diadenosine tetraphosphate (Ap4A) HIT family hydrolase